MDCSNQSVLLAVFVLNHACAIRVVSNLLKPLLLNFVDILHAYSEKYFFSLLFAIFLRIYLYNVILCVKTERWD